MRGDTDLAIVKIGPSGTVAWRRFYDSGTHWNEAGERLATSSAGLIVVTGVSYSGVSEYRGLVSAWTPRGHRVWTKSLKPYGLGMVEMEDVLVNAAGRTFVCGALHLESHGEDLLVASYGPTGRLLWKKLIDGGTPASDRANALAFDAKGDVYVAGQLDRAGTNDDLVVLKYDVAGHRKWMRVWDAGTGSTESGTDIAVRGAVVAISGYSRHPVGKTGLVARYDTAGKRNWVWIEPGPDNTSYYSVAVDRYSHIAVGGGIDHLAGAHEDFLVARYEPYGGPADWMYEIPSPGTHYEYAQGVAMAAEGDIYAAGATGNADATLDAVAVKLRPGGSVVWLRRYSAGAEEEYRALRLDAGGVTVAGHVAMAGLVERLSLKAATP